MKPLFIARQGRRPSGLLGEIVARIMAVETSSENNIALSKLKLKADDSFLEIGSGHGATLARAGEVITEGRLAGVDFSRVMHRNAQRRNRQLLSDGRLALYLGSSDKLPFENGMFTKALTTHTVYFWKEPVEHLREIYRVMKPTGRFTLVFRPSEDAGFGNSFPSEVYHIRSQAAVEKAVQDAGFSISAADIEKIGTRTLVFMDAVKL